MKLKDWLKKNKMSVTKFAKLMKIDRTYVHQWRRGRIPGRKTQDCLRDFFVKKEVKIPEDLID